MSPPDPMRPAAHRTIGLLTANIHVGAARSLWRGALDAAQARNASLICFPGGRLHLAQDFEAERNILYNLIDLDHLEGLVSWTSALAGTLSPLQLTEFHTHFRSIPVVSLAQRITDEPLVSINGYEGMRAVIFHLIDVHHYERIAFIGGPEGHPYATERYEAYLDALSERGITPDPALITPSTSWEQGAQAMRSLLDERQLIPGVDFQAVTAVSDLLAIDAIRLMVDRGIRVPEQVAVVGFNDIEEGRLVRPSLTSVSLPFYEQGRCAVEILLDWLDGASVPQSTMLDSRLLVRQSCGCPSQSVDLAASVFEPFNDRDIKQALRAAQVEIGQQISRVISKKGIAATWAKQLLDAFYQEMMTGADGPFRVTLDGMLQQGLLDGDETAAWQTAISLLRREVLPSLDADKRQRVENLFGQARVVIGEAIQRAQAARQLQTERQNAMLREIGQALSTAYDIDSLADVLTERLPEAGIHSFYLALYDAPSEPVEWARLVLAYTDGQRAAISPSDNRFPACQLIPFDLLPSRRFSLVVEPLYFQTEPIGFMVLEIGPRDGEFYEVLRGHISSALKGALLFKEADEARRAAERADQVKTALLANVSHELRTPLNIIIGNAQRLLSTADADIEPDLQHIRHSAEHQLRIINDLLDLSRAEIHALDLYPAPLDPHQLISEAFAACSATIAAGSEVRWQLDLPDALPPLNADPVRLHQILLNLLSNAAKFTASGQITLGAEETPPYLHIWVADTGSGVPPEIRERIYEPFFTHREAGSAASGIGLGLSITKRLVELHQGLLMLDSESGRGSTFHVYLPLMSPDQLLDSTEPLVSSTLWMISNSEAPPQAMIDFGEARHLSLRSLLPGDDPEIMLASDLPAVIAWDVASATPDDWLLIRRLHNHPKLSQTPFIFYQQEGDLVSGLTSLVVKPASSEALWQAIRPTLPEGHSGSVIIIDDDPRARQLAGQAVSKGLPDYTIRTAENGRIGLAAVRANPPDLVILDLMMPEMDGFTVLDHMRADDRTRHVPVVILSGRQLSMADIQRLEQHAAVTLRSKNIFSEDEIITSLHQALFNTTGLPPQTSALAKRTLAYLHQSFDRPLTREEIAQELGVSDDYLSRIFSQELGLSPWDYLNRYRIARAKELLLNSFDSIAEIGRRVGFSDPAYFARVFRKITGMSASEFREHPDS